MAPSDDSTKSLRLAVFVALIYILHREHAAACPWYHKCYTANVSGIAVCGNQTMRRAYVELRELHDFGGSQRIDYQMSDLWGRFTLKGYYEETVLGTLKPNLQLHVRWRCPPYPTDINIPEFCFKKIRWNNWDVVCRGLTWDFIHLRPDFFSSLSDKDPYKTRDKLEKYERQLDKLQRAVDKGVSNH